MKRNKLEASAQRLGMKCRFSKLAEQSGQEAGWYLVSKDGVERRDFLGRTIQDALISFESKYDAEAYLGGMYHRA
jgi:hypothetical protein